MRTPASQTYTLWIDDPGGVEIGITYTRSRYYAATGPTYDCGGTPESGGEVEIISIERDGKRSDYSDAEEVEWRARIEQNATFTEYD